MVTMKWCVLLALCLGLLVGVGCKKGKGDGAAKLQSELEQLKSDLADTQKKRDEYRASLEQTQRQLEAFKKSQAEVIEAGTGTLRVQIETLIKERDEALTKLKTAQAQIEDLTGRLDEQTQKAEKLEKELEDLSKSMSEVSEEVQKLEIPEMPQEAESPNQPQK
jgi:chromosome segregation ATPase